MELSTERNQGALFFAFNKLTVSYKTLKEKQKEAILAVLGGKDVLFSLPTGYGKTIVTALLPYGFDWKDKASLQWERRKT